LGVKAVEKAEKLIKESIFKKKSSKTHNEATNRPQRGEF